MDSFNDTENAKSSKGDSIRSLTSFALVVLILQMLISIVSYPFLPDLVPSHWNLEGQVDGYVPRLLHVILFPAMTIGLYVLFRVINVIGPRWTDEEGMRTNRQYIILIIKAVLVFMLVLQLTITAIAVGMPVDLPFVISLSLSLLWLLIGNSLGKVRRNAWVGIRTPWTLLNETVWERTHRVGGWLFVAMGLVGVVCSFLPPLRMWATLGLPLLVVVFLFVYSYRLYQEVKSKGSSPSVSSVGGDDPSTINRR